MKRISIIALVCMLCAVMASAQMTNPIRWRMSVKMDNATEGTITLRAAITNGWHLYGLSLPENGPKPTKVDFAKSTGIKLTGSLTPKTKKNIHAQLGAGEIDFVVGTQALISNCASIDPDTDAPVIEIQGEPPSPVNPGPGCYFANRCFKSCERCFKEYPPMQQMPDGRVVSCFCAAPMKEEQSDEN